MIEEGIVERLSGSEATVRLQRKEACSACKACSVGTSEEMVIKAVSREGVAVGSRVVLEIDPPAVLKAILLVYLLPAAAFILGIVLGLNTAPHLGIERHKEAFSVLAGLGCSLFLLYLGRLYGEKNRKAYKAKITRIIG